MPMSPRLVDACGIGVLALIAAGCYTLGIRPLDAQAEATDLRAARVSELTSRLSERVDELGRARSVARSLSEAEQSRRVELATVAESGERMAAIAASAESNGIEIRTMRPAAPRADGLLAVVPITLSGTGDERALRDFLATLHEAFPDVRVDQLEFSAPRDAGGPLSFSTRVLWSVVPDAPVAPAQ